MVHGLVKVEIVLPRSVIDFLVSDATLFSTTDDCADMVANGVHLSCQVPSEYTYLPAVHKSIHPVALALPLTRDRLDSGAQNSGCWADLLRLLLHPRVLHQHLL